METKAGVGNLWCPYLLLGKFLQNVNLGYVLAYTFEVEIVTAEKY